MMKGRIVFIDYLKALAIFLVIIYHSQAYEVMVMPAFLSMCVAIFFAVNGYLMLIKRRSYDYLLRKNLKIIFLIFFWGILRSAFQTYVLGGEMSPLAVFSSFFAFKVGYGNYMWFLVALFILNLVNPLFYTFVNNSSRRDKIIFCILLLGFTSSFIRTASWKFNPLAHWYHYESLFYYVMGYFVISYSSKIKWPWHYCGGVVLVFFLLQVLQNFIFSRPSFNLFKVVDPVFFNYSSIWVMGETLALLLFFSKLRLQHNKIIEYIGSHTLGIYLLQDFFCSVTINMMPHRYIYAYPLLILVLCVSVLWVFDKSRHLRWLVKL